MVNGQYAIDKCQSLIGIMSYQILKASIHHCPFTIDEA